MVDDWGDVGFVCLGSHIEDKLLQWLTRRVAVRIILRSTTSSNTANTAFLSPQLLKLAVKKSSLTFCVRSRLVLVV